jgi:hypothetical protein
VPSIGAVVRGGAYITIIVARAGVALQGTVMKTSLVPLLSLIVGPSGKITACFDVSVELRPLQIQLQARFAYFGCVDMVEVCSSLGCLNLPLPKCVPSCSLSSLC